MADDESWKLREDGYLNIDSESKSVICHPNLNVILVVTKSNEVIVVDVNSGSELQRSSLSAAAGGNVQGTYLQGYDKVLFTDGITLGVRSDYNGVILLDTLLQPPVEKPEDVVKLEMPSSEATLLSRCLRNMDVPGVYQTADVLHALGKSVREAEKPSHNNVKAQKWNTVCLELPHNTLKVVCSGLVSELKTFNRRVPILPVVSALNERLNSLWPSCPVVDVGTGPERSLMYSEAARRQTFAKWPHMNYKWALPDQMAQAGFYHQPNAQGDDRAMCFTCVLCLVCWEPMDEPWSEHERHSPTCPFVKGEYTQNVPLAVTNATAPAIPLGLGPSTERTLIGLSAVPEFAVTASSTGNVNIWNVERQLLKEVTFIVSATEPRIEQQLESQQKQPPEPDNGVEHLDDSVDREHFSDVPRPPKEAWLDSQESQLGSSSTKSSNVSQNRVDLCGVAVVGRHRREAAAVVGFSIRSAAQPLWGGACDVVRIMNSANQASSCDLRALDIMKVNQEGVRVGSNDSLYLALYDLNQNEFVEEMSEDEDSGSSGSNEVAKPMGNGSGGSASGGGGSGGSGGSGSGAANKTTTSQAGGSTKLVLGTGTSKSSPGTRQDHQLFQEVFLSKFLYDSPLIQDGDGILISSGAMMDTLEFTPASNLYKNSDYTMITSPVNLGANAGNTAIVAPSIYNGYIADSKKSVPNNKVPAPSKSKPCEPVAVQCVPLPEPYCTCKGLSIKGVYPSKDGNHVIVVLVDNAFLSDVYSLVCPMSSEWNESSMHRCVILVYALDTSGGVIRLERAPTRVHQLEGVGDTPLEVVLFPTQEETGYNSLQGLMALVGADGVVRVLDLNTQRYIARNHPPVGTKFVSATFCNNLESLCACTNKGSLHFFTSREAEESPRRDSMEGAVAESPPPLVLPPQITSREYLVDGPLGLSQLKLLFELTECENLTPCYAANVPPCWSEMLQAQKQRRHPQHLQQGDEAQHTRTWRLQSDSTTWDEHVFELMLPKTCTVGHVYLKICLHSPCPSVPNIQVTLLRPNAAGIGYNNSPTPSQEFSFSPNNKALENPVTSEEYLRSHNTEVLCGPVKLASCLDLSDQSGTIMLTSSKLLRTRCRTLQVHLKALNEPGKPNSNRSSEKVKKTRERLKSVVNMLSLKKTESYSGCDWLLEVSIAIRRTKQTNIPDERDQRCAMLKSNSFAERLLKVVCSDRDNRNPVAQGLALDILIWIASVRLSRYRSAKGYTGMSRQQLELARVVENCLPDLIRVCFVESGRSIAHKGLKFIIICSEGMKNLRDSETIGFDSAVLRALLDYLNMIPSIESGGALHCYFMLLTRTIPLDVAGKAASICVDLLLRIAQELNSRANPYHLLLHTRLGLDGMPFEPELFDVEPPIPAKTSESSTPVTYASVVSAENMTTSGPATCLPNVAVVDLKELLSIPVLAGNSAESSSQTDDTSSPPTPTPSAASVRLRGLASNHYMRGLLQVEPLHFTCHATSDGTKVEKVDSGCHSAPGNFFSWGVPDNKNSNDDILPWHQLLVPPPQQTVVTERMHSGARRFVVMDFGAPVILTDVLIPSCSDLFSLSIDVWAHGEDKDGQRLVVASDIATKALVLSNLEPPPVCRYLKITTIGSYGMTTTRCKIPIGSFYGHTFKLPGELPSDSGVPTLQKSSIKSQLSVLSALREDIHCRYSLSCSRLRELLSPLLQSEVSNAVHMHYFLQKARDIDKELSSDENRKVVAAYQECMTLQHQMNVVRSVMLKLEGVEGMRAPVVTGIAAACTDKLRTLGEGLLDVLLYLGLDSRLLENVSVAMDRPLCEKLFRWLCVGQHTRMQLGAATLLLRLCGTQPWWGNLLADTLVTLFSSNYSAVFPMDRVFIVIAYLGRKSLSVPSSRASVIDAALETLTRLLQPLLGQSNAGCSSGAAAQEPAQADFDIGLLGWLLLYVSQCLDVGQVAKSDNKRTGCHSRWDFIQGEVAMQRKVAGANRASNTRAYRRLLKKKPTQQKDQMDGAYFPQYFPVADFAEFPKVPSALTFGEAFEEPSPSQIIKKIKALKDSRRLDAKCKWMWHNRRSSVAADQEETENVPESALLPSLLIPKSLSLPVAQGLIKLILSMDFTCNVDLFLLACKVLARIVSCTRPVLLLGEFMSQEELNLLIELAVWSDPHQSSWSGSWGGSWASHSITCLLQDILEGVRQSSKVEDGAAAAMGVDVSATASGSGCASGTSGASCPKKTWAQSVALPTASTSTPAAFASAPAASTSAPAAFASAPAEFASTPAAFASAPAAFAAAPAAFASASEAFASAPAAFASAPAAYASTPAAYASTLAPFASATAASAVSPAPFASAPVASAVLPPPFALAPAASASASATAATAAIARVLAAANDAVCNMVTDEPEEIAAGTYGTAGPSYSTPKKNFDVAGPSLLESEDSELEDILDNMWDRSKASMKKVVEYHSSVSASSSISVAMDARLEYRIDSNAEMLIRRLGMLEAYNLPLSVSAVFQASEGNNVLPPSWQNLSSSSQQSPQSANDTLEMLITCFNAMFNHLPYWPGRSWSNLESLLELWLTLNSECDPDFTPPRLPAPVILLGPQAISAIMAQLAQQTPEVSIRTWSLCFHCFIIVMRTPQSAMTRWSSLAEQDQILNMISDGNFPVMLKRFLSGEGLSHRHTEVGPTVCKAMNDFILDLMRCGVHSSDERKVTPKKSLLKVLLFGVACELLSSDGALSTRQGPLDAQSNFFNLLFTISFETIDLNLRRQLVESVITLTKNYLGSTEKVRCRTLTDGNFNAATCFSGQAGSERKLGKQSAFESLLCTLIRLANSVVNAPLKAELTSPVLLRLDISSGEIVDVNKDVEFEDPFQEESKVACLADTVLEHYPTMHNLLSALASCTGMPTSLMANSRGSSGTSTRASGLAARPPGSVQLRASSVELRRDAEVSVNVSADTVTVGDTLLQLLLTLARKASSVELLIRPVFDFLISSRCGAIPTRTRPTGVLTLSEPLLWYLIKVLDTEKKLEYFLSIGGISVICKCLVISNEVLVNSYPSLVSVVMQHLSRPSTSASNKKMANSFDSLEGLQNLAPLGTISCSCATVQPADVLIAVTPSHRRARTPAWSYHFYPQETHMDLTVRLPCAILLREIQLAPHLTSLATCPSAVGVEVSRDGNSAFFPVCQPLSTSGMTYVRLTLPQPEVVTAVLIRLYRPHDSTTVGLSQIKLLGTTTFGESAFRAVNWDLPDEEFLTKTSLGWLRLLYHCMTVAGRAEEAATEGEMDVKQSLHSRVVSEAAKVNGLLEACCGLLLLPVPTPALFTASLESVMLQLGLHSQKLGLRLISTLLGTGPDPERAAPFGQRPGLSFGMGPRGMGAFIGQHWAGCAATESLVELFYLLGTNKDSACAARVEALLQWLRDTAAAAIKVSSSNATTKDKGAACIRSLASILWDSHAQGVNYDLASLISTELFNDLYQWTCILPGTSALKSALDAMLCSICFIKPELFCILLDQMRAGHSQIYTSHGEKMCDGASSGSPLTESQLMTLALASQSPPVITQLLQSGLPNYLSNTILEFCKEEQEGYEISEDASISREDRVGHISSILKLFSELCSEGRMRDWLGSAEGSTFWSPLLNLLCSRNADTQSFAQPLDKTFAELESATLRFLSRCISCHKNNRFILGQVLCNVIEKQKWASHNVTFLHGITGFTRRLVLQLLLESEKLEVVVHSKVKLSRPSAGATSLSACHPSHGVGHHRQVLLLSTQTTFGEIIKMLSGPTVYSSSNSSSVPSWRLIGGAVGSAGPGPASASGAAVDVANGDFSELCPGNGAGGRGQVEQLWDIWESGLVVADQLSMAAGVLAKDKRAKEAKNLATRSPFAKKIRTNENGGQGNGNPAFVRWLEHYSFPDMALPPSWTLAHLISHIEESGERLSSLCLKLTLHQETSNKQKGVATSNRAQDLVTPLRMFTRLGGLALLAEHLPLVYPESLRFSSVHHSAPPVTSPDAMDGDWVKVEGGNEAYEELDDGLFSCSTPNVNPQPFNNGILTSVPPHSLAAFGLFLRLPGYAEMLLKDYRKAQCMLRLVLGVSDDGEGGDILNYTVAQSLPTLPFQVLRRLLWSVPLSSEDGLEIRQKALEVGAVHLVLACLGVFTHQSQEISLPGVHHEVVIAATKANATTQEGKKSKSDEKSQNYWAKGTGFGTGSTSQSWNVEQALMRQRSEEEHVTALLQVLSAFLDPGNGGRVDLSDSDSDDCDTENSQKLSPKVMSLLRQSCLLSAVCSYLRNDSVMDMARHIPLYRAVLELLRSIALNSELVSLLLPSESRQETGANSDTGLSPVCLLTKMKNCVDAYATRLKNKNRRKSGTSISSRLPNKFVDDPEHDEGLADLIADIQHTANVVTVYTNRLVLEDNENASGSNATAAALEHPLQRSVEERYLEVMRRLQFDTFEMITESSDGGFKFAVSYHFESNLRTAGERCHPARVKRLAQETVTLSTSLPLSYSSSVYVRCDVDRLDIMKVLITGPAETPYANGCFEFDVYFPPDYPNSPMMINMETTGHHSIRFNPNLYNDGKVCLSVLNTWHGRPEEKWNAHTSSFLQVLVSIQSLILVPEPYFNEPGYERSRGTPAGNQNSREYNANICQAAVKWAMLEQVRNPCPCFKEVIHTHFWIKRKEIIKQIKGWLADMEGAGSRNGRTITHNTAALKRHFHQLEEELAKLKCPSGLEDLADSETTPAPTPTSSPTPTPTPTSTPTPTPASSSPSASPAPSSVFAGPGSAPGPSTSDLDADLEMEKIVSTVCD